MKKLKEQRDFLWSWNLGNVKQPEKPVPFAICRWLTAGRWKAFILQLLNHGFSGEPGWQGIKWDKAAAFTEDIRKHIICVFFLTPRRMGTQVISFLSIKVKVRSSCAPRASKLWKQFKEKQDLGEIRETFNIKSLTGAWPFPWHTTYHCKGWKMPLKEFFSS